MSFAGINICVAFQRVFVVVVDFVIDLVRKLSDKPSCVCVCVPLKHLVPTSKKTHHTFAAKSTELSGFTLRAKLAP
jgi:hypothetical protein